MSHVPVDAGVLERLTAALEALAIDPELRLYTPGQAAELLGKTENWVIEAIQSRRIPFTYVGKSPRLTATHIREIAAYGEVRPNKYTNPQAA